MASVKASAAVHFIIVLIMVTFSAATEKPTEEVRICSKLNNENATLCEGVEGLKFSNVSKAASRSSPRGPSSVTPATKSPTGGGRIPRSPTRTDDGSSDNNKSMGAPHIIALQALLLVISCISFLFIVFSS